VHLTLQSAHHCHTAFSPTFTSSSAALVCWLWFPSPTTLVMTNITSIFLFSAIQYRSLTYLCKNLHFLFYFISLIFSRENTLNASNSSQNIHLQNETKYRLIASLIKFWIPLRTCCCFWFFVIFIVIEVGCIKRIVNGWFDRRCEFFLYETFEIK